MNDGTLLLYAAFNCIELFFTIVIFFLNQHYLFVEIKLFRLVGIVVVLELTRLSTDHLRQANFLILSLKWVHYPIIRRYTCKATVVRILAKRNDKDKVTPFIFFGSAYYIPFKHFSYLFRNIQTKSDAFGINLFC